VIDASIAHAAGSEQATFSTSKNCRDFLKAMLALCQRLVLTKSLAEEWDAHRSRFTKQWLRSMFARKQLDRLEAKSDQRLRKQVAQSAPTAQVAAIMDKDCHLIEAAQAAEKRIVSLDERVRAHFHRAALHVKMLRVKMLRAICWVNPDRDDEQGIAWLEAGAPNDKERRLGYVSTED
jgi:hypothetical protein